MDLPHPIQRKLEQTLSQSPQWQCDPPLTQVPEVRAVLAGGRSNYSVLVKSASREFVVRIDGSGIAHNGLNRHSEWRMLHSASEANIAPTPCYFNPELGSLVCDYLEPDQPASITMKEVAALLRAIHDLPRSHHRLNLSDRIARLEKTLESTASPFLDSIRDKSGSKSGGHRRKVHDLLEAVNQSPGPLTVCHNDLLQANRIYSGGNLWAIDWEYCAMGSPWFDLAVVIHGDELSADDRDTLTEAYLGRQAVPAEELMLYRYGAIYSYLEILWYETQAEPTLETSNLERKKNALMTLLNSDAR